MSEPSIQLVNPNLHVIFIHFPIAMLFVGTAIELFAFLWRTSGFRAAGRWMILLGALMSIPAATTGMFAARQAMGEPESQWSDLKLSAHLNSEQWFQLMRHIRFNVAGTEILIVLLIAWLGATDRVRQRAHLVYLLILLVAVGLISAGGWRGGELVYANGTGVGLVKGGLPQAKESGESDHAKSSKDKPAQFAFDALHFTEKQVTKADDALDIHASLAGWTIALAVVTLGLSIRRLWREPALANEEAASRDDDIVNALAGRSEQRSLLPTNETRVEMTVPAFMPAARFWLLAFVAALMTAWMGWVVAGPSSIKDLQEIFNGAMRAKWHIIMGVSIVALTLILALVTRFAPRNRILVGGFGLILACVLGMQLWLGILLMFDTSEGPINHFNAPTTQGSMT